MTIIFKVKKDLLYSVLFYGAFILFFFGFYDGIVSSKWLTIILMPIFISFFAWIWFGSRYSLVDGMLIIRIGPFKRTIEIAKITTVRKTKSVLASAALAIERLEINYAHYETIQISPVETDRFITELKKIEPDISVIE